MNSSCSSIKKILNVTQASILCITRQEDKSVNFTSTENGRKSLRDCTNIGPDDV